MKWVNINLLKAVSFQWCLDYADDNDNNDVDDDNDDAVSYSPSWR